LPALEDTTTNKLAKTWFLAGEIFHAIYEEQQKIVFGTPQGQTSTADRALMGESLKKALQYYTVADSLDRLPDKKGKVKPKYTQKIVDKVLRFRLAFPDAGAHFYRQNQYMKAVDMFEQYINYPKLPFLRGRGLENDTLITTLKYNSALSALTANRYDVAAKYLEEVKDSIKDEKERSYIYLNLSEVYQKMKDSTNMLRMYQLGARKFPKERYYTSNLINHYINKEAMGEALVWINSSLEQDANSAVLWHLKGRIIEKEIDKNPKAPENAEKMKEVIACYEKAIELDPKMVEGLVNIGRIYYNTAVEELQKVNDIKDDKKYKAEKAKLKAIFEKPKPYFEKAYELEPENRECIIALRAIYYNTDNNAKYKEMDDKYNKLLGR
jgi:tetratricopeptide (TPR) repeat protein